MLISLKAMMKNQNTPLNYYAAYAKVYLSEMKTNMIKMLIF